MGDEHGTLEPVPRYDCEEPSATTGTLSIGLSERAPLGMLPASGRILRQPSPSGGGGAGGGGGEGQGDGDGESGASVGQGQVEEVVGAVEEGEALARVLQADA